ncbi:antirestriction protein [Salmonella enterica subsp. enterica]|jgi:hypothetical protein|uniref:KlcA n=10 Tax=Bacteria TaxID=2 RepID=A0A7U1DZN4_ECOLX|nr:MULTISPECIES: antirestriction protein [Gammaproteobacteria]AFY17143.1 antirestriction protein [bacterium 72B]AGH89223.1 KlcA: antirestriction protein [uncultured bacterium]EAB7901967.1 antirestriction protein [Salmonella enterica subsp. enterica serovar Kentucky]EAM3520553.1 antirestriction protein [Salmonella enterica]EBR0370258.1 antirestriction protein [Salmonella enterica subsp. enterica serovar Enteritidis]EBZ2277309.1 antirestriction protein [Salmonella enterica subsp. enterica serov
MMQTELNPLICSLVATPRRMAAMPRHVGRFYVVFESMLYQQMKGLCREYRGAYWLMWELSNGGFYMAPGRRDEMLNIEAMNYFSGQMSADAAGITACLYLYSHLSFHTEGADQERFSRLYHSLRDWACEHDEKEAILAAID